MRLFRWNLGRRESGYEIFPIIYSEMMGIDLYLIRFKTGSYVRQHIDECGSGRTFRLNVIIRKASKGGVFWGKTLWSIHNRVHWFRPDICPHGVTKVRSGTRYSISFGIIVP
jgi:hypothetical protein